MASLRDEFKKLIKIFPKWVEHTSQYWERTRPSFRDVVIEGISLDMYTRVVTPGELFEELRNIGELEDIELFIQDRVMLGRILAKYQESIGERIHMGFSWERDCYGDTYYTFTIATPEFERKYLKR
jgi:hypothetical protein